MKAPERGALIWLTFTPQSGREQAGRRPALVVSPSAYNSKVGLALVCPITSKVKGYPFEVPLPDWGPVQGVVLATALIFVLLSLVADLLYMAINPRLRQA